MSEVKKFKKLRHPNIIEHIEAYEVKTGGKDIHGSPIVSQVGVLEYADGGTLADLMKQRKLTYQEVEEYAEDIINSLAYLHNNNIIHRDLKPSNILLFKDGARLKAKITDFGIAKITDAATAVSTQIVGTVEYMAPEYFKEVAKITYASDLWSLGVILLEAVTGKHPFGKISTGLASGQIISNILTKDVNSLISSVPQPLNKLITDCLRQEPLLRPQTAEELVGFLSGNGNVFGDKTQVISSKRKNLAANTNKVTPKRFTKELFDFDLRNNWRRVIARELILFLLLIISGFLLPIIISGIWNPISSYRANQLSKQADNAEAMVLSINEKMDRQFEFSYQYFGWTDDGKPFILPPLDSDLALPSGARVLPFTTLKHIYTPIGFMQKVVELADDELENKDPHFLKDKGISQSIFGWRHLSYDSFARNVLESPYNGTYIFLMGTQGVSYLQSKIRERFENTSNISLFYESISTRNFTIDMESPNGSGITELLFTPGVFTYEKLPNEIEKRLNQKGWAEWFFQNRVDSSNYTEFKSYLIKHDADNPIKFKSFMRNYILFNEKEKANVSKVDSLAQSVSQLDSISTKIKESRINLFETKKRQSGVTDFPEYKDDVFAAILLLLIVFYPLRLFFVILLWAIKTLRN